jgi:thiol-disulfide isomerase/thioredoxin
VDAVFLVARIALAVIFVVSAIAKIRDADDARRAIREFGVPDSVVPVVAMLLAPLELASAVLLLTTDLGVLAGGVLGLGMLLAFTVGIVTNLARGRHVECHCFGALSTKPLSWWSVARNVGLIALAAIVIAGGSDQGWPWQVVADIFDGLSDTETALTVAVIVLAVALLALLILFVTLLRRYGSNLIKLEELESTGGGAHHSRAADFAPWPAPELLARDGQERAVSLADVASEDRANLFVFVAPWCEACGELVDELVAWQDDDTGPNVVVLSGGERDAIAEKFGAVRVFGHDGSAIDDFRMEYTPGAVVVSTDHIITTPPVYGSDDVRRLYATLAGRLSQDLVIGPPPVREGDPAPDVIVEVDGDRMPIADVARDDAVLLFWDTECGFCQQIQDDVIRRQNSVPLVLVLRSNSEEAVRAAGFTTPVALDPTFGVGGALQLPGTPSAVRLRDGAVASTVAVGGPEVLNLLASVRVLG